MSAVGWKLSQNALKCKGQKDMCSDSICYNAVRSLFKGDGDQEWCILELNLRWNLKIG